MKIKYVYTYILLKIVFQSCAHRIQVPIRAIWAIYIYTVTKTSSDIILEIIQFAMLYAVTIQRHAQDLKCGQYLLVVI